MHWNADLYKEQHAFVFEYGNSLIDWLQPKAGEKILDLGCGTGELTAQLAAAGATVTGIDASEEMITSARSHYPELTFQVADATDFSLPVQFDAVFSNATLHWINEKEKVIRCMYDHLKQGGRLALEFGGKGNVASIVDTLARVMEQRGYTYQPIWYFPSPAAYATLLENAGFRVDRVHFFERPTRLADKAEGISTWLNMFGSRFFEAVPPADKADILRQVQQELAPQITRDGELYADYVRLRIAATKI
ncbi:methyltransferase domain-containing protein [Chitinophaga nivalis]|uniref:Methyltransferase domain-containing protein n=1 Tax=Chitinophaga nivalis TaxID=2991709 RepID=A0ABT3IRK4_9BACT|nr:methyltransferase domain-containing protein [Chitinophaga nivalis]MCW3463703.1 methyltransferase domain-containing protein [Chitinophaga nivalis]MCW3486607.1 methyltransferase domain-containing protein [Chitinophaga nivalis]